MKPRRRTQGCGSDLEEAGAWLGFDCGVVGLGTVSLRTMGMSSNTMLQYVASSDRGGLRLWAVERGVKLLDLRVLG